MSDPLKKTHIHNLWLMKFKPPLLGIKLYHGPPMVDAWMFFWEELLVPDVFFRSYHGTPQTIHHVC